MSKAEKLKKNCKKVWNWFVPIAIISLIIGAILIVPKYYNKSGNAIKTSELTAPSLHNWEIWSAVTFGLLFFGILISVLVLNGRRKSSKLGPEAKSYGKVWKWVLIIIAMIVAISLIAPKYIKEWGKEKAVAKLSIPATVIWKKKPHQYGRDPEKRTSGYLNAEVTEDSKTKFCFTVFTGKGNSYYNGRRKSKEGKIEGSWRNPPDGGKWYLEKDKGGNPNLYKGGVNDPYLSDWADFELEILN